MTTASYLSYGLALLGFYLRQVHLQRQILLFGGGHEYQMRYGLIIIPKYEMMVVRLARIPISL